MVIKLRNVSNWPICCVHLELENIKRKKSHFLLSFCSEILFLFFFSGSVCSMWDLSSLVPPPGMEHMLPAVKL